MEGWQQRGAPRCVCPRRCHPPALAGQDRSLQRLRSPPRPSGAPRKVPAVSRAAAQPAGQCPGDSVPLRFAGALHKEGGERAVPRRDGISAANNALPWGSTALQLLSTGAQQRSRFPIPVPGSGAGVAQQSGFVGAPVLSKALAGSSLCALGGMVGGTACTILSPGKCPTLLRQGQELPWEAEQQESSRSVCPAAS